MDDDAGVGKVYWIGYPYKLTWTASARQWRLVFLLTAASTQNQNIVKYSRWGTWDLV